VADYDSAWCLARFRKITGTSSNAADATDADAYVLLSNAQRRLIELLSAIAPHSNMDAPQVLTTADSGATYTLASYPLSHLELYDRATSGNPIFPVGYGQNTTDGYVLEGQTIRWPGGATRTFANGLYARYVKVPLSMSAAVEPVVRPADARLAMCYDAASEWAHEGGAMDPAPFDDQYRKIMRGDPGVPGSVGIIGRLQTQARGQGLASALWPEAYWWRGNGWVNG
jgi:hypothetical protein